MIMIEVRVLHSADCENTQPAIDLIQQVVEEFGISAIFEQIQIDDIDAAIANNYLGSPTIRINGLDIDPKARNAEFSGFA